jgi:glutathione reductase (NADPH)
MSFELIFLSYQGTTERVTSKTILVATGGSAVKPEIPGAEFGVTSDEARTFDQLPKRILIIGGGYIALEFAGIFQGFGSEVSLMYRQPLPLRGFDSDLRETVNLNLKQRNINVHENCIPERITRNDDGSLQVQSSSGPLVVDAVMFATGRQPNTTRPDLGLEQVGVDLDENRAIIVNEFSQTSIPSIWAIGDVTNRVNLTPVALMEGMAFVSSVVEGTLTRPDYKDIPCAVFSQPPVATVGLSEEQAIAQGYTCDIFCSTFTPMRSTLAGRKEKSLMKLVVDTESERVLGVHMVGIDAPEIMQGFATALKCGATKSQFDATVGIHPSSAEEFVTMRTRSRQVGPKTQ